MINVALISGFLPRDAESPSPNVVKFTVCSEQSFGEGQARKEYINCCAFGRQMDSVKHLRKGDNVLVTGRIETRGVEKDGKKVYYTNIVVNSVDMLSTNGASDGEPF